jgi:hypothetical protein
MLSVAFDDPISILNILIVLPKLFKMYINENKNSDNVFAVLNQKNINYATMFSTPGVTQGSF